MNRHDSLRGITRRAIPINYRSPMVCQLTENSSGSSSSISSVLDFFPVLKAPGTVLETSAFSAGKLRLSWAAIPEAFVYVIYRSDSPDGLFTVIASGVQALFYVDTPDNPGIYYYRVSGIEPNHGETELSNVASGTV